MRQDYKSVLFQLLLLFPSSFYVYADRDESYNTHPKDIEAVPQKANECQLYVTVKTRT